MKHVVGRVLANPVVKTAIITAVSDIVQLYAKAFINVVRRKIDDAVGEKQKPEVIEVTLED